MWGLLIISFYLPISDISAPRYSDTVQVLLSTEIEVTGMNSDESLYSLGRGGLTLTTTLKF
jgi:hypothetical protein